MTARVKIEEEVGRLLSERGLTLAIAESCTGGLIAFRITSVSGSSAYFQGGLIAYSNEVKKTKLGVARELLEKIGAVSAPVARQMALNVRQRFGADIGIAVTGIAGPGGGTAEKPVGLVFIGLAEGEQCHVRRFCFSGDREAVRMSSSEAALEMLRNHLSEGRGSGKQREHERSA